MELILPTQKLVLKAFSALTDKAPGTAKYLDHVNFINMSTVYNPSTGLKTLDGSVVYIDALNTMFSSVSTDDLSTNMLANLGLSSIFTQAEGVAYISSSANRVKAVLDLAEALSNYAGPNAAVLAAKAAYNNTLDLAYNYSTTAGNTAMLALNDSVLTTFSLTTAVDTMTGTEGMDNFVARTLNNVNTLNDADTLTGGAGTDTLYADLTSNGVAITPKLNSIETVIIRAQTTSGDPATDNNMLAGTVQIDAQRSLAVDVLDHVTAEVGVTRWESNNSRSDVVIEDVRIGNSNKTSDVTIAMVETDPGNVDFAVYFDQQSLRNQATGSTTLTINLMDTGAAGVPATAATPLLNNPYDQFKFAINGVMTPIQLDKVAVAAADTYEALLAVFQTALAGSGVSVSLGANFTVIDPISTKAVTGKSIVITGDGSAVITAPPGSGWFNTTGASVPATSNIYTTYATGATSVTELVTSKVVLDDVGRSNLGGDLVIGGMSTGQTSNYTTYRGVERFEITVNDNSKLQTINSSNNALREVTIASGATSKTVADAYTTTVTNEGDLVVNGDASLNLALKGSSTQIRGFSYAVNPADAVNGNNLLAGVENNSPVGIHHGVGASGFTDVRLIDASQFKGKLGFTAAITQDTIAKYVNLIDIAPALPAADIANNGNVNFGVRGANFIYTGGNDDDTMTVTIDAAAASSRSTVISGQSDFTFAFNGGEGNDAITVQVINGNLAGGAQAWYNNQKLNANIAIGAGDGDDVVRTPGAGDIIIDAGTGNDTVYTDNTGSLGVNAIANGASTAAAIAYTNAAAAELAAAQAVRVLSNATGFVTSDGVAVGTYITPTAQVGLLAVLDAITPTNAPALPVITHAALAAGTTAAAAAGAITLAQKVALDAAYNSATGGVVTPAVGVGGPSTLVGHVAVAGAVTAAELAAGDALLATYVTAAKAAEAIANAADAEVGVQAGLLNATQAAVNNTYMAVNGVEDLAVAGVEIGTANIVAGLATLQAALVNGTTQAAAVAAIDAATDKGVLQAVGVAPGAVLAAVGAGAMDPVDAAAVVALLSPLQNTAALNNAAAVLAYNNAVTADTNAVNTAAGIAAGDPIAAAADVIANNFVGSTEAAAAALAASQASARAAVDVAQSQAINTALNDLKAAVNVGTLDAGVTNAIANANAAINAAIAQSAATGNNALVGANPLTAPVQAALLGLAGVPSAAVDAAEELAFETGALGVFNANSINSLIIANTTQTDLLTVVAANRAATATATATAATIALAAANSGGGSLAVAAPTAVYVFDTSNQAASYNRLTMDDRNLADLKSDANNSNNFFNSTLKVTYKGIDSSVTVAGTGYKTTDLEINQSIKQAINSDPVLSKLLLATDGPANTLVVTSLIDGTHVVGNLAVTVTMPTAINAADLAGATTAYGLAAGSTEAQVLAAINAAKVAFDAKGDYTTQFAESGAAGGNTLLVGANSTSSSDNTITLGTGNDVLVLGTTVGTDLMTSSNEKVIYSGSFGNDTIVHFDAAGLGIDMLDFTALKGSGAVALNSLTLDKSIVIGAPAAVALTAAQIAALFTDSATAIDHVYVAVDTTNIGSVWQVADAAGTAAGNVVATLVGSIDLADTAWGTLTSANFAA
jgi:hypothetical protein